MIVTFPERQDLPPEHPCWFKPNYWGMYAAAVKEQLFAAGYDIRRPEHPEPGIILRMREGERGVAAIFDYADQWHVDGLVKYARERTEIDVVFKHKLCGRALAEYRAYDRPLVPAGYFTAPSDDGTLEEPIAHREWFSENLARLRARRSRVGPNLPRSNLLMTRGSFHAAHVCPERERHFHRAIFQGEKGDVPWRRHMEDLADSAWLLNLCGPDNTIDRKVVEATLIGVPMISNDGLEDLLLPWGARFVHGKNVHFIKSTDEIVDIALGPRSIELSNEMRPAVLEVGRVAFDKASIGGWIARTMQSALNAMEIRDDIRHLKVSR